MDLIEVVQELRAAAPTMEVKEILWKLHSELAEIDRAIFYLERLHCSAAGTFPAPRRRKVSSRMSGTDAEPARNLRGHHRRSLPRSNR
jgi:hypothetical protein